MNCGTRCIHKSVVSTTPDTNKAPVTAGLKDPPTVNAPARTTHAIAAP